MDLRPLRVLLVDDQQLWRTVVAMHLSQEEDFELVGEAADGPAAVALAAAHQPDLVVLDLDLAGESGAAILEPLKAVSPDSQVVVLSGTVAVDEVVAAFGAGAVGYLPKDHPVGEFADALRSVARGRPLLPPEATTAVLAEFRRQSNRLTAPPPPPNLLSDRERQVLHQLALGRSNRQIGTELYISENTVKNHVRNILAKLEVSSRVEAVSRALGSGLISTPLGS
ncbi:MAG: yxjL [Frankiales bacterium]|nr:yxjL [Frankiales bacterium]